MGNCIVRQNRIMHTAMEVTQHKEHMKFHGQTYYPVPVPLPKPSIELKKNPEIKTETGGGNEVVRIKLVISKQELEVMLRKGGVSVGDLVSHMKKESSNKALVIEDEDHRKCGRWRPILDSIPEYN